MILAFLENLEAMLAQYRFRFTSEKDLQDGIEAALKAENICYTREQSLNLSDRPDFIAGGIAIEVKIKGSMAELLRQASRYAQCEDINAILVVGTPHWLTRVPTELCGKPVHAVRLMGSLL